MKKTLKKVILAIGGPVLVLALLFAVLPAAGQEPGTGEAPLMPAEPQKAPVTLEEPPEPGNIDGFGLGFIPPPRDMSHLVAQAPKPDSRGHVGLPPPQFDWRNNGGLNYVTSVKNQSACGSCYAFASIANFESREIIVEGTPAIAPAVPGTPDYSENNAKECNWEEINSWSYGGYNWGGCSGGNYWLVANLLSQKGTVLESCDPYVPNDGGTCVTSCPYQKTLLDWSAINGGIMPDTTALKDYIQNHGPIYTTLFADGVYGFDGSYNGSYTFDYYPGSGYPPLGTNHAVMIVGWSNNLPPTLGNPGQPADGWIVKNSWGPAWGANGYFYITYGSANIGWDSSFVRDWQDYDSTGGLMLYDEAGGWWAAYGYSDTDDWGLCKFTPSSNVDVTSIEFWMSDSGTISAYIYDDFNGTAPSNLLWSSTNNRYNEAGYYSIELGTPISQSSGDDIIAVVRFDNDSYAYPLPVDDRDTPYESNKTYISSTGASGTWYEMGNNGYGDVAIRLRTEEPLQEPDKDYGDAPEGDGKKAYPALGIDGQFPTCVTVPLAGWVQHGTGTARFEYQPAPPYPQPGWDGETDGNAGLCPNCFPTYDDDECYLDGDAGLMTPEPFTIDPTLTVVTCPNSNGIPLGNVCNAAVWGGNIDIWVINDTQYDVYVNVLMDWNHNGQWSGSSMCTNPGDAPEHVLVNFPVPARHNGPLSNLTPPNFTIGPNSGYVWSRFTISDTIVDPPWNGEGQFNIGESEDYLLYVMPEQSYDFGDAPQAKGYPTLLASDGARHLPFDGIFLDGSADYELDGQPDPNALGDDNDGYDDENGVSFTSQLFPGQMAIVDVNVSPGGYSGKLNAWIDFNIDGDWADAGEQIFTDANVSGGTQSLNFMVPPGANSGITYSRFRLNSLGGLSYTGIAGDGEVEDYEVFIEDNEKWNQPPDISEFGIDIKVDDGLILADDWLCTETSMLTDVHFWGSWLWDQHFQIENIHLSVHTDIPDPDGPGGGYSMPGTEVWSFNTGEYPGCLSETIVGIVPCPPGEGWWDPRGGFDQQTYYDTQVWRYDILIPGSVAFVQTGTTEGPVVYWLDIAADVPEPLGEFGWKTSYEHWNDDAVWSPDGGVNWIELRYPQGHPYAGNSIDLAYVLTFGPYEPEPEYEYGDAPEESLAYPDTGQIGFFPTCTGVGLPSSYIEHNNFGAWFGPGFDFETDGNAGFCPLFNPNTYDMDECCCYLTDPGIDSGLMNPYSYTITGLAVPKVVPCPGAAGSPSLGSTCHLAVWGKDVDIWVHNTMPGMTTGFVNVLIDWNHDGVWSGSSTCTNPGDAPEHALQNFPVPNGFVGPLSALVPPGFITGPNSGYAWARFSITEQPVPPNWDGSGVFEDGETEDYLLKLDLDFGDAPAPYPTTGLTAAQHMITGSYYLGSGVDGEPDGQPDPFAMGDDNAGIDDEDGVTFATALMPGREAMIDIVACPSGGTLNAWIDFDSNGDWADGHDRIFSDFVLNPGLNKLKITLPAGIGTGNTFARFRSNSDGGLNEFGVADDGEVEDYIVLISTPGPIYVDESATAGNNTGTSWADAYIDLHDALNIALSGDEIWVADGVYKPGNSPADTFQLVDGVAVYGGFSGSETARIQRDWSVNETILSGSGTCYHVVYTNGVQPSTIIDGFTITEGNANGGAGYDGYGGGMLNLTGGSPTVVNCIFSDNYAAQYGGAMENDGASPSIINCIFHDNTSGSAGGAMDNYNNSCSVVTNCTFNGNSAGTNGSGINNESGSDAIITNCIFWGDSNDEIYSVTSTPVVTYCDVEGSHSGTGNIDSDPLWVNPGSEDFHLGFASPCFDAGTNSAPGLPSVDFEKDNRIINGTVDMGVDEGVPVTIRVKLEGTRSTAPMQTIPGTVTFWSSTTIIGEGVFPSGGTIMYTFFDNSSNWNPGSATTDLIGFVPDGNYVIEVKEDTSISNFRGPVMVNAGTVIYMGELQEGDTTQDGRVNISDLTQFKIGYPCFSGCNPLKDYDGDGKSNITDFTLFKTDYPKFGPHLWTWK